MKILENLRTLTIAMTMAVLSMTSCVEPIEPISPEGEDKVTVTFSLSDDTKSSITKTDTEITTFEILAYKDQRLQSCYYTTSFSVPTSVMLTLLKGTYTFYAVANYGAKISAIPMAENEAFIKNLEADFTEGWNCFSSKGFPMCWSSTKSLTTSTATVSVVLERLVSKWNFRFNNPIPEKMYLTSVSIKQVNTSMTYFGVRDMAWVVNNNGDRASAADLTALNNGETITLYIPENAQGTLLPSNSSSYGKNYSALYAACNALGDPDRAERCTYISVTCGFHEEGGSATWDIDESSTIEYRFYLGENTTTNFDIIRNTEYTMSITPTIDSLVDGSIVWQVDNSNVTVVGGEMRYTYSIRNNLPSVITKRISTDFDLYVLEVGREYIGSIEVGDLVSNYMDHSDYWVYSAEPNYLTSTWNEDEEHYDFTLTFPPEDYVGTITIYAENVDWYDDEDERPTVEPITLNVDFHPGFSYEYDIRYWLYDDAYVGEDEEKYITAEHPNFEDACKYDYIVRERQLLDGEPYSGWVDVTSNLSFSSNNSYVHPYSVGTFEIDEEMKEIGMTTVRFTFSGDIDGRDVSISKDYVVDIPNYHYMISTSSGNQFVFNKIGQQNAYRVILYMYQWHGRTYYSDRNYTRYSSNWTNSPNVLSLNKTDTDCYATLTSSAISFTNSKINLNGETTISAAYDGETYTKTVEYKIQPTNVSLTFEQIGGSGDGDGYLHRDKSYRLDLKANVYGYGGSNFYTINQEKANINITCDNSEIDVYYNTYTNEYIVDVSEDANLGITSFYVTVNGCLTTENIEVAN